MKRRLLAAPAVVSLCLLLTAPLAGAQPAGAEEYTSPDRRTGPLPFVKIDGMEDAPQGRGLERYTSQTIRWHVCGAYECATILAPMDYANPDGIAITLNLKRKKASQQPRIGSILMNPGGPGVAGTDMPERDYPGLRRYDIVGFDPRGTGGSTPVQCYERQSERNVPESDTRAGLDQSPDDDTEYQALLKAQREFGDSCATYSGVYLEFLTTNEVIQDMDLLRKLLGEDKLTYLGYSYGTFLGAMYAHYYPERVGRMVLDSPVNITTNDSISQAQGFDRALGLFADWAAKRNRIGSSKEKIIGDLRAYLDKLDAQPVKIGQRELTQSLMLTGVLTFLYGTHEEWGYLEEGLRRAYAGRPEYMLQVADSMNERDAHGIFGTAFYAFPVMMCADGADKGLKAGYDDWADEQKRAPFFGKYFGPGAMCEQWPVAPQPIIEISAPTAATPIVVIGSKGDPATPYEYAPWMVKQLGNARLVTWEGAGHGTYGGDTAGCVNRVVNSYLVDGKVPDDNTVCKP